MNSGNKYPYLFCHFTIINREWYRTVSPGNPGEVIFTWSDTRYGMRNIFSHKVNQEGEMIWGSNGAIVTNLPGRQEDPVSITDGNGGVYIAWVDYRFDEEGDIFLQHLDTYGNRMLDDNGIDKPERARETSIVLIDNDSFTVLVDFILPLRTNQFFKDGGPTFSLSWPRGGGGK